MRHTIIFLIVIIVASPCAAQWISTSMGAQVITFGVHDTNIFLSSPGDQNDPTILRYDPWSTGVYKWFEADAGIDFTQGNVTSFASLGEYFFAGMANGPSYQSTNNGSNWTGAGSAAPVGSNGVYLFGQYVDPSQIIRSTDSGKNWVVMTNLAVSSYADIGWCIFANTGNAIWRSTDSGSQWSQLSPPIVGTMTTMGSLIFITGGGNVIESTDSGTQWSAVAVDSGKVQEYVTVLATDGKNLFAGTTAGVYLSMDTDKTWLVENSGLGGYLNVDAMCVFDTLLFVNSSQRGGWYTAMRSIPEMTTKPDSTQSVVQTAQPGDTIEVYPNPATGIVTILSGGTSILQVSVMDVLGVDMLDMPNLRESEMTLDLSKFSSGTYLLLINTSYGSVIRRVVVIK